MVADMSDDSRATFTLRASRALLDRLKDAADARSHSMNAEIVQRLEESLYLSKSAHALEGEELTDGERAIVQSMREMGDAQKRAILAVVSALISSSDAA